MSVTHFSPEVGEHFAGDYLKSSDQLAYARTELAEFIAPLVSDSTLSIEHVSADEPDVVVEEMAEIVVIEPQHQATQAQPIVMHFETPIQKRRSQNSLIDTGTTRRETGYDRDSFQIYLDEVGQIPLLEGREEEVTMMKLIESGRAAQLTLQDNPPSDPGELRRLRADVRVGRATRERFLQANLRLVISVAKKYPRPYDIDLMDLIQEGNLGLDHAIDKFEWEKGFKFSTYATFWIRQRIGRALDQKAGLIRLPGQIAVDLRAAQRAEHQEGVRLTAQEQDLVRLKQVVHYNKTVGENGETEIADLIASDKFNPEADAIDEIAHQQLAQVLANNLSDQELRVLSLRYGLVDGTKHSFRSIGQEYGITAEAARRQVGRVIQKLRTSPEMCQVAELFS